MKNTPLIIIIAAVIISCGRAGSQDEPKVISAEYFLNDSLFISEIARSEEVVTLAESETAIISRVAKVARLDDRFIVCAEGDIGGEMYIFSQSGRPLRRIGVTGRGPEEIGRFRSCIYNESRNTIEVSDAMKRLVHVYDTTGNYISNISFEVSPDDFAATGDGRYLLYMLTSFNSPDSGRLYPGIYLFGSDGEFINPVYSHDRENYQIHSPKCFMGIHPGASWLTAFDDDIYRFDADTAIRVMSIDFGEKTWPAEKREAFKLFDPFPYEYIYLKGSPLETRRYISFHAVYFDYRRMGIALIDKKEMTCRIYPGIINDFSGGPVTLVGSSETEFYGISTRITESANPDQVIELRIFKTR